MSFLTHLECGLCGARQDADRLWNLCPACGKPLPARYDLKAAPWEGAATVADGLRVPAAVGDFLILRALRAGGGTAVAVSDREMVACAGLMARTQGIFACSEGGATLAAFRRLRVEGWIAAGERVVLFNTGSGLKYAYLWQAG